MDVLGIGPLELLFVILIALIIIGPKDMTKTARAAGRSLNRMYRSETWRLLTQASRTIQTLPNRLAREAELEELEALRKDLDSTPPAAKPNLANNPALEPWVTPYDTPDRFKTIAPPSPAQPGTATQLAPAANSAASIGKKPKPKSRTPAIRKPAKPSGTRRAPGAHTGKPGAKKSRSKTAGPGKAARPRAKTSTKGSR